MLYKSTEKPQEDAKYEYVRQDDCVEQKLFDIKMTIKISNSKRDGDWRFLWKRRMIAIPEREL